MPLGVCVGSNTGTEETDPGTDQNQIWSDKAWVRERPKTLEGIGSFDGNHWSLCHHGATEIYISAFRNASRFFYRSGMVRPVRMERSLEKSWGDTPAEPSLKERGGGSAGIAGGAGWGCDSSQRGCDQQQTTTTTCARLRLRGISKTTWL